MMEADELPVVDKGFEKFMTFMSVIYFLCHNVNGEYK